MIDSTNLPEVDINQIATDLNGKMDKDGINATASVCVESYHDNNGNWYRVYSDGWCEQGGLDNSGTGVRTIALLKSFTNTDYSVLANSVNDTAAAATSICTTKTTTNFVVYKSNSGCYWEAKGFIR